MLALSIVATQTATDIFLSAKSKDVYIPIWAAMPPTPRLITHSCSSVKAAAPICLGLARAERVPFLRAGWMKQRPLSTSYQLVSNTYANSSTSCYVRKADKQLHTVIDPPGQLNVGWYATMAVSEDFLRVALVYVVENLPAASDVQVFTKSISVTLYFQYNI